MTPPWYKRAPFSWIWPEEVALVLGWLFLGGLCYFGAGGFTVEKVITGYQPMFSANLVTIVVVSRVLMLWRKKYPSQTAWYNGLDLDADVTLFRITAFLFGYITLYSNLKIRIPIFNPVVHDASLVWFEQTFLGNPVEVARRLSAYPSVVEFLDRIYHHDYIFMTLTALYLHVQSGPRHVRHLFVSMAALYLTGVLLTIAWPTLGPCFYDRDSYQWMEEMGLSSWDSQSFLLKSYDKSLQAANEGGPLEGRAFAGIAALPSLHVGHCMLLARFGWHYNRWLLVVLVPITLLTWVATLTFGWHYLSDGLVSIPLVLLSWWISRRLVFGTSDIGTKDPAPA